LAIPGLGPSYIIWDKAATIRFRRPGRETLYATFRISSDVVAELKADADAKGKVEREFTVDLVSADQNVYATCQKVLSIRRRDVATASPTQ
jgi:hypothetical protein